MSPDARFGLDQRGATMVFVALIMVALLGVTALAIDIGMILTARTEAQRTADAAAHAGAVEWLLTDGDEGATRSMAQQVASTNLIIAEPPDVSDEDVEFLTAPDRVRVTVWRTADRGNPVPTFFARVLGIDEVDINAVAAAGLANSCGAGCPLPLALIDEWIDVDDDDLWDEGTDQYIPYPEPGYTGYSNEDAGLLIEIKDVEQGGGGPAQCADTDTYEACNAFGDPSWDCWWLEAHPSGGGGGDNAPLPRDLRDPDRAGAGVKRS